MKRFKIIPSTANFIEEVANLCLPSGADYSSNLVVFPGKRPAHFLRRCIAGRGKGPFIPPVILSMEEFIDRIYEGKRPGAGAKMETIDAAALLFEIHAGMEQPLGGRDFLNLETFFPLGLRIYRDIEELRIERVDTGRLKSVEELIDAPLPRETGTGLQSLSFFYEKFYEAIRKEGLSSRSERFRCVSDDIAEEDLSFERVVFAGFYALTECERRLFRKLLAWDRALFLFQQGPGIEERVRNIGGGHLPDVGEETSYPGMRPTIHFHKSPDSHGQVFDLAGILREQLAQAEGGGGSLSPDGPLTVGRTVIVLPSSETLFPLLYHALPLVPGEGYNVSLGYPLGRTPTWGFLSSLIQAITSMDDERFYTHDYLGLVLHPYAKNIYMRGSAEITRIIFHTIEESLMEDRTKSFVCLDEIEGRSDIFRLASERASKAEGPVSPDDIKGHLVAIHDAIIRKVLHFKDIGDFAGKMMEVLSFIYDHSSARQHPYFHPFAESFMKELDVLKRSRVRGLSFAERNSYFHFLKRYVAQCFTPFEGTPLRGIQVLGFLETRNLQFDRTYIVDANEDVIPDTRKEESLLPLKVRQVLGMPTYMDRDRLSAYYFHTLVDGSREVHLFFTENGKKEKSRFVEQLLWERQKRDGAATSAGYVRSLGYHLSLETSPPPTIAKSPSVVDFLKSRKYDATSLDCYLKCPLQFYYRYVLNFSRREDLGPDVERLDIGRIVHRILLVYFKDRTKRPLTAKDIDFAEMNHITRTIFEEAYGPDPVGTIYLLRRQILSRMEAFLRYYQTPLIEKGECIILELEHRIETEVAPFVYHGIVDRIETRNGTTCIVDYKTGASGSRIAIDFDRLAVCDRNGWNEAIGSLQLPFYLFLCEQASGLKAEEMQAMFVLLGKIRIDEGAEAPLFGKKDDWASCYSLAKDVIFSLVREIADPGVPFDPRLRAKDACKFCDFRHMCALE